MGYCLYSGVYLSVPAIAGSSMKDCARAATVGVEVDGEVHEWQRWSFPSLQCLPLDRIGLGVGNSGGDEPRTPCPWSPPPLYSTARQGPPALLGLDAPDQGVGQGPNEPLGPLVERST